MANNSSKTQKTVAKGTKSKTKSTAAKAPAKNNAAVGKKSKAKNSVSKFRDAVGDDKFKSAIGAAINIIYKDYENYRISQTEKKKIALKLGVDGNVASSWENIIDILDFIDISRIAEEHPEELSVIVDVLCIILVARFHMFAPLIEQIPRTMIVEFVATAGQLSPEHVLKIMLQQKMAEEQVIEVTEETESSGNILSKLPSPSLPGFASKKEEAQPACVETTAANNVEKSYTEEDVFETLKKLAELKSMGIITEEEFNSKKVELLARI